MKILIVSDVESELLLNHFDESHKGYFVLKEFVEKVSPKYFIYGHNHLSYGRNDRITHFKDIVLINAYEKYVLTI